MTWLLLLVEDPFSSLEAYLLKGIILLWEVSHSIHLIGCYYSIYWLLLGIASVFFQAVKGHRHHQLALKGVGTYVSAIQPMIVVLCLLYSL